MTPGKTFYNTNYLLDVFLCLYQGLMILITLEQPMSNINNRIQIALYSPSVINLANNPVSRTSRPNDAR